MTEAKTTIVFAIFPGVTQLDFTGPHQVFSRVPGARVRVASAAGGTIEADGLAFSGLDRLAAIQTCDVLCIPGGAGTGAALLDADFIAEIQRLAAGARYLTSVCTGSLILGAAGLLRGKRAACHWASLDLLERFGAVPDPGRVVRDGNVITGGGVTAGIDFALTLAAEIAGRDVAQAIQLTLEYAPAPPFQSGAPDTAPPEILERVLRLMDRNQAERTIAVETAAARL